MKKVKKNAVKKVDGKRDSARFWIIATPAIIVAVIEIVKFIIDYIIK